MQHQSWCCFFRAVERRTLVFHAPTDDENTWEPRYILVFPRRYGLNCADIVCYTLRGHLPM